MTRKKLRKSQMLVPRLPVYLCFLFRTGSLLCKCHWHPVGLAQSPTQRPTSTGLVSKLLCESQAFLANRTALCPSLAPSSWKLLPVPSEILGFCNCQTSRASIHLPLYSIYHLLISSSVRSHAACMPSDRVLAAFLFSIAQMTKANLSNYS